MNARPDPRVAFGMEALALAQLALAGQLTRGFATRAATRRLWALWERLGSQDMMLARPAVLAFEEQVLPAPEAAGRAMRDFLLDWSCDVA